MCSCASLLCAHATLPAAAHARVARRLGSSSHAPPTSVGAQLHEDVARFAAGVAAVPRVLELIEGLCAGAAGNAAALQAAAVWQQNAEAWIERLGRQHPLYRDVVQPVQVRVGVLVLACSSDIR